MTAKTVLIADGEPALLQLLTLRCGQGLGLRVKTATDGPQAQALAAGELPDLIIVDANMPGADQLSVFENLAADPKLKDLPLVVLTSPSDEDAIRRCETVGARHCHKGPELWQDLDAVVRDLLDLEPQATESASTEAAGAAPVEPAGNSARPPTVLMIDADAEFGKAMWSRLDALGVQVFRAPDGKMGMMIAEQERPDVIIAEYNPSDSAGDRFLTDLKSNQRAQDIPIILLADASVDAGQQDALIGRMADQGGTLTILSKPLDFEALLDKLQDHIELSGTDPNSEKAIASSG